MSSEVKHTPLPWKISRYGIGFEIEGVVDGEPHVIAQTQQLRGTDRDEGHWERKANTEFIVTAVNNYATLERQLSDLREKLDWTPISPDNLPTPEDEVLMGRTQTLIVYAADTISGCDSMTAEEWDRHGYTHRRPIHAPLAAPRGSK